MVRQIVEICATSAGASSRFHSPLKRSVCLFYSRPVQYTTRVRIYIRQTTEMTMHHHYARIKSRTADLARLLSNPRRLRGARFPPPSLLELDQGACTLGLGGAVSSGSLRKCASISWVA